MNLLPPPAAAFAAVVAPLLALLRPLATLPLLLLLLPPVLEVAHAQEAIVCPAGPDRCIDIPILKEETCLHISHFRFEISLFTYRETCVGNG